MSAPVGLEDVIAAHTAICDVDGARGRLVYRGERVEDLVAGADFEAVAGLVVGASRDSATLAAVRAGRGPGRALAARALPALRAAGRARPLDAVRTAVSAVAGDVDHPPTADQAYALVAAMPYLVAAAIRLARGGSRRSHRRRTPPTHARPRPPCSCACCTVASPSRPTSGPLTRTWC